MEEAASPPCSRTGGVGGGGAAGGVGEGGYCPEVVPSTASEVVMVDSAARPSGVLTKSAELSTDRVAVTRYSAVVTAFISPAASSELAGSSTATRLGLGSGLGSGFGFGFGLGFGLGLGFGFGVRISGDAPRGGGNLSRDRDYDCLVAAVTGRRDHGGDLVGLLR